MKKIFAAMLMLVMLFSCAFADLDVYFLDVGQGDAAIVICDGEVMMIDGGEPKASQFIYAYITETLSLTHIDYMVATHPDADHIGGLSAALNAVTVGTIYSSATECDTKTFQSLLKYTEAQGKSLTVPETGDTFSLGGATVTFLGPVESYEDDNNNSLIVRLDYKDYSFLFMGDAEQKAEADMLRAGANVRATVLKVAHHGSASSSSDEFIKAVHPSYAVISVGKNNKYSHPKESVLKTLRNNGANIFRTDKSGTIHFRIGKDLFAVYTDRTKK